MRCFFIGYLISRYVISFIIGKIGSIMALQSDEHHGIQLNVVLACDRHPNRHPNRHDTDTRYGKNSATAIHKGPPHIDADLAWLPIASHRAGEWRNPASGTRWMVQHHVR